MVTWILAGGGCSFGDAVEPSGSHLNESGSLGGMGPEDLNCSSSTGSPPAAQQTNCAKDEVREGCRCTVGQTHDCFSGDPAKAGVGTCVAGLRHCESAQNSEL